MPATSSNILYQKLDEFIRKYYKNLLIKGFLYFVGLMLIEFLIVIVLAHIGKFGIPARTFLFYFTLLVATYLIIRFLIRPISGLLKLGKNLGYEEASEIVGKHFPEINDRLLNTLQLLEKKDGDLSHSLLEAAIEQRTNQLSPVPFTMAIDFSANKKYAFWAAAPLVIYLIIYLLFPSMIPDGTIRVLKYNRQIVTPPPFKIEILNSNLKTEQFNDFELMVDFIGDIPEEAMINYQGHEFRMEKRADGRFSYLFSNPGKTTSFRIDAGGLESEEYKLEVIAKPAIYKYTVYADYPSYTGRKDEEILNPGDVQVPEGTTLKWKFITKTTDEVLLGFDHHYVKASKETNDLFTYLKKVFISSPFSIKIHNLQGDISDSMQYELQVIPDNYPVINLEEKADSNKAERRFFIVDSYDDYGLTRLTFNLKFTKSKTPEKLKLPIKTFQLQSPGGEKNNRLYHQIELDQLGIVPEDEIEYYFEVWDNDGAKGPKSTKSRIFTFKAPSIEELEAKSESDKDKLQSEMEEAIREAKSLQKDLKSIEQKLVEKKDLSWEEKKKMEQLVERQKKLGDKMQQIKESQKKINEQEKSIVQPDEELMKKQEQIDKMFNELMNDEMKDLIRKVEQMMQMQNKDQIKKEIDKLQLTNKDIEKEMDRMLEHFKELELEKKMEDAGKKLDELSERQKELSKETEKIKEDKSTKTEKENKLQELSEKQNKLNEEFKRTEEKLNEIDKSNKELETPKKLDLSKEDTEKIEKDLKESKENLDKKESEKAAGKQKEAAEKMKELSQKMKDQMEEEEKEEDEVNAESLRSILDNTLQLSNDQERLMQDFKQVTNYNPQYVLMAKKQKDIKDNARQIEDSLTALSKKVPELSSFVNKEVTRLNENLENSIQGYGSRDIPLIRQSQQQAMMNANNLGVMLSDILKQMQEKMSGKSSGKAGKLPKTGQGQGKGKGKSMSSLKKMQEELNKQLREGLNKQDGKGNKPGEKPGQQQGMGSMEYAKMAAQQMAIRQQMQKMLSEMGAKEKEGLGGQGKLQELQRLMEQTEKELFNKRLSNEMIQRQEDIMTRMLESEKAEKKQDQDKKREAEQAKEKERTSPPSFKQYIEQRKKEQELLLSVPTEMQPYYKDRAKQYFNLKSR